MHRRTHRLNNGKVLEPDTCIKVFRLLDVFHIVHLTVGHIRLIKVRPVQVRIV